MWTLKHVCRCACSDGVPQRSLIVAVLVGTVLNLINQGDVLLSGESVNWIKAAFTYFVPYAVCTYGAVSARVMSYHQSTIGN